MDFENPKTACYACTAIVLLVVVIGGAAWSVGTVEPIEYGIKYNSLSKNIDEDGVVYTGGWYFIGPLTKFITYPSTAVNIDFSRLNGAKNAPLFVRSSGGLGIDLSFSF